MGSHSTGHRLWRSVAVGVLVVAVSELVAHVHAASTQAASASTVIKGKRTALVAAHHPKGRGTQIEAEKEHEQAGEAKSVKLRPGEKPSTPGQFEKTPNPLPTKTKMRSPLQAKTVFVSSRTSFIPSNPGFPEEPEAASGGGVVMFTGNADAYFSVDNGTSFTEINPTALFQPGQGTFCCDQVVRYSPVVNRFFWLLQANGYQDYVLAVSSPERISTAASSGAAPSTAWTTYFLPPSLFNDTKLVDFPDMAVGPHALWVDWDRVGGNGGKTLARLNLVQLAAGGPINIFFWKMDGGAGFLRLAQQPNNIEYLVGPQDANIDPAASTIHFTSESSPNLFTTELRHAPLSTDNYCTTFPPLVPGTSCVRRTAPNWMSRAGYYSRGATVAGSQLWIEFDAGRDFPGMARTSWSEPHIQLAVYDVTASSSGPPVTFHLARELVTVNQTFATAFGELATDPAGDIAMSYSAGGPTLPPGPYAMVLAGSSTGSVQVASTESVPLSTTNFVDRTQGDYSSIQPDGTNQTGFVTAGYTAHNSIGRGAVHMEWTFARIGLTP
jgi:hypothetical protein